uniref:Smoothened n=1 Tax=Echinococcus granulosus TaxID=6210 RepID=A0A068WWT0_ECHGR|nr:smoothened [Echinococcus granulosus]
MCYLSLFFDGRTLSLFLLSFVFSLSHGEISALDTNKWLHNQDNCTVTVAGRCKPIDSQLKQSCLGTPLPYDFTSDGPIIDDVSHFDLQTWAALRAIPTCWVKLQIFLCTVYVPECQRLKGSSPTTAAAETVRVEYSQVVLPERGMCLAVRKACPLLFSGHGIGGRSLLGDSVPRFLQCDIYAPVCRQNKLRPKIFDANKAECQAPLMSTTNSRNWIKGIATCAFPCRSPIYRPEHYTLARNLIFAAAVAGILVNVCVLFTLRLIRSSTSFPRYGGGEGGTTLPMSTMSAAYRCLSHTALTFIHLAFLIGCLGLLIPHLPGVDDAVACRADGSVRVGEPQTQTGSPILCVICFMLVYIPMLAVALWSNVLDYAIFAAFHTAASLIVDTNFVGFTAIGSTPALRRRRLSGGVWRLQCWRYKHPALLLPPDSCELPKRRLRSGDSGGGVNEAMEGSVSPASPAVSTVATGGTKRRLSAIEMEEKAPQPRQPCSQNTTWKLSEGDRPEHQSLPLVCRLLYPTTPIGCALANHAEMGGGDVVVGQRATFNSIGSQITCIRIAAFAVPVVFALIGLTASEIDGEPLSGLCLVGIRTLWAYCAMVVAPLVLCLFLKVTYLSRAMRSIWQLRGYLVVASYAPVDREMAHRLTMCFRAYVIYILTLTALLTFSAGVHAYAYVEEPKWLETQRLFLFCQLRHRLMGLDGVAASSSCRTPFTTDICFFDSPLPNSLNATAAAAASTITSGLRVRREDHQIVSSSTSISSEEDVDASASGRPLAGPILLNLFTYLMSNLVFASMCLLDASVKHKWLSLLRRVISFLTACPKKSTGSKPFSPQMIVINKSTNFHLPATFSWWDPGIFFHDYEVVPVEEVKVSADNGSIAVAGGGGMAVTRTVATSDVSCGCSRRYSLSTNDGSWVMSSVGATNATSTIRGVGGNTSSVASSNAAATTAVAVAAAKPIHKSNSLTSSQSLFTAHRGHKPRSSAGGALFNPFSSIQREEEVAATLEHNLGRPIRRSRYRRMWSSKGLGRRRLVPRSYSTLGLAGGGSGGERRSLNSLLLHRAVSSPTNSSNGKCASGAGRGGHSQQDLSIGSLSRLCAAAAAMELERSRKILDGGSQIFGHAPRGSTAASWTRRGGTTSRLSLASSSGAESYNSFQLLAEQAGATWRELWRTRLLLIDALHWAQSAAAASATENPPPPPPQTSDQQQQQLIAATSMMMAYLMGQQQQQPVEVEASCGGEESTPDSVMMAALMAATAAAQAAMHQSGPPQQSAGASLLPPIPTLPTSPLKKMPHYEVPLATPAYPIPKGCQPDILADYNNLHHHLRSANTASTTGATVRAVRQDVVCHLDASAAAGVSSPPHLLHPAMQQLRSPWGPSHQPPPQPLSASGGGGVWSASTTSPGFTHFSLPVIPPYAFVPPPPPHIIPPPAIVNTSPNPERGDCVEGEEDEDDDGDDDLEEGSDAFNSEDEVMSTSGEEATETMGAAERRRLHRGGAEASAVDDYWDTFPTPEGQPSCAAAPPPPPDADADDVSSVSQSASQVVVATVHGEAAEVEADAASEKSLPKS